MHHDHHRRRRRRCNYHYHHYYYYYHFRIGYTIPMFMGFVIMTTSTVSKYFKKLYFSELVLENELAQTCDALTFIFQTPNNDVNDIKLEL